MIPHNPILLEQLGAKELRAAIKADPAVCARVVAYARARGIVGEHVTNAMLAEIVGRDQRSQKRWSNGTEFPISVRRLLIAVAWGATP